MSTKNSVEILSQIEKLCGKSPKVFVTATYKKPLEAYGITEESKLTWDINDIKIMKDLKSLKDNNDIRKRFGKDLYDKIISKYNLQDLVKSYKYYPEPHLITSIWDAEFINKEKSKIGDTNYGFDMEKLLL